jgi:arylsulfatase A-like enzyme
MPTASTEGARAPGRLNTDNLPYGCYYNDMPGTYLARRAATFFQKHQNVPFALWVSFLEPHSPFDFSIEYTNLYSSSQFSVPPVAPADLPRIPLCFRSLSAKDKQGIAAAYYTSVNYLDRNIGVVLDALREQGMEQNTLVVYMPDHSYVLGHHGWFEKCCGYEQALRVPLIMRWPGHIQQGAVVQDFTESVDVAPTILELLGVSPIPLQQGQLLRPYLAGLPHATPRSHIFSQYLENEEAYIRTDQYKFMYCSGKRYRKDNLQTDNPRPGRNVRLYDLWSGPNEVTDVSQSWPTLVADFKGLILDRFLKTHPEAGKLPKGLTLEQQIEFFLRPRDA